MVGRLKRAGEDVPRRSAFVAWLREHERELKDWRRAMKRAPVLVARPAGVVRHPNRGLR